MQQRHTKAKPGSLQGEGAALKLGAFLLLPEKGLCLREFLQFV